MSSKCRLSLGKALILLMFASVAGCAQDMTAVSPFMPEQKTIEVRNPDKLPKAALPDIIPPETVSKPRSQKISRNLSLDDAIRIALENSQAVRVLTGISASASGRTIYDAAITNTTIDQEQGRFDPQLNVDNTFDHLETPQAILNPFFPAGTALAGNQTDIYNLAAGVSKIFPTGGTASISFDDAHSRFYPGVFALSPQERRATTLRFDQPLLQGAGLRANLAPIVIARINTERSYFQFKDAMQEMVRGVIEAYWGVVFARTEVWVREKQVEQGKEAYDYTKARQEAGFKDFTLADVSQAKTAWANFKANLVGARANLLQREAALRNIMGLPPSDPLHFVPVTPLLEKRLDIDWDALVRLAEERRPDLIELKLIIEADQQLLEQSRNQALPKVDAVALYRWNGLEGTTPTGAIISTGPGQYTDWTVGVNFSLPLGLRKARAALRQQKLIVARDWVNLDQGLHAAVHDLAIGVRNIDQFYEQYQAFKDAREAARINLQQQVAEVKAGRLILLNVLQAITDWGNAVSAEAQSLAEYNTALATLERKSGTILETHGIFFYEERFAAIGPLGRLAQRQPYPATLPPGPNAPRYPASNEPAENRFNLDDPLLKPGDPEELPRPNPVVLPPMTPKIGPAN